MAARAVPDNLHPVVSIVGTRPEAIKMAPVVRALAKLSSVSQRVLLTGQHEGLESGFEDAVVDHLRADVREQSAAELRDTLTEAISRYLAGSRPDLVIVQGDTTSALAGALAAWERGIPVAHVEAGLRSHQAEPWPEEDNRVAIDALADILFAPTEAAAANLALEAAVTGAVHVTGNSGIDALFHARRAVGPAAPLVRDGRKRILVTCHRRENRHDTLPRICLALKRLANDLPVKIVFMLHLNRHVRSAIAAALDGEEHIELMKPACHPEMVRLMLESWILLTDSGGIQEEGPALGRPVLVMRGVTERSEAGLNAELVGTDPDRIAAAVRRLLDDQVHYARMAQPALPFGDGQAAPRIAALVEDFLAARARKRSSLSPLVRL